MFSMKPCVPSGHEPFPMIPTSLFQPWVGSQYDRGLNGTKVLLLGESHYGGVGDDAPAHEVTSRVVQRWAIDGPTHPFFTKAYRVVCGTPTPDRTREEFWNSVAFYNYVQAWVGNNPRVRPTPDEWKTGAAPFQDVLAALCPDRVVVLGKELWNQLPSPQESRTVTVNSNQIEIRFYSTSSHTAQAAMVHHPSYPAFSYARWRPVIRALLDGPM